MPSLTHSFWRRFVALFAVLAALGAGHSAFAKRRRPPPRKSTKTTPRAPVTTDAPPPPPSDSLMRPGGTSPAASPPNTRDVVQRESKIEFDERAIQGQTAAGAIYLFQRGESEFKSMIEVPDSFRIRTVRQILPDAQQPSQIAARADSKR